MNNAMVSQRDMSFISDHWPVMNDLSIKRDRTQRAVTLQCRGEGRGGQNNAGHAIV